jgi:uncharacterized protein (DUF433 family)
MLMERIQIDPAVCSGKPVIAGTRIPVHLILDLLAADETIEGILLAYPGLKADDIKACIKYAAGPGRSA